MKTIVKLSLGLLLVAVVQCAVGQNYTNTSHTLDATGQWSTGGMLSNITAVAQSGGVAISSGGVLWNQAGFLNTFVLKPGLDTDADGLADEEDTDNDNDALTDCSELDGSGFSPATATNPNTPDSDSDGALDGAEAAAGTDPSDPYAFLRFVSINCTPDSVQLGWFARSNKTYRVMTASAITNPFTNLLAEVTVHAAAAAPWYVVTNYYDDTAFTATNLFYRVLVVP